MFDTTPASSPEFINLLIMKALDKSSTDYDYLLTTTRLIYDMLPPTIQAQHPKIAVILHKYENNLEKQRNAQRISRILQEPESSTEYLGKARGQDQLLKYDNTIMQEHSTNKTIIIKFYANIIPQIQPIGEEDVVP